MSLTIDHHALLTGLARYHNAALDGARDGLAVAIDWHRSMRQEAQVL